jgi:glycosyltransferase involved in cell wall biosynthesis
VRVAGPIPLAVVMTSFDSGGTERQMTEVVRRLDPTRWAVHLACLHARGPCYQRAAERAVSVGEFPIYGFRRPQTWRQALAFARWCTQHQIAIVQTSDFYTNVFGLPAAAFARVPVRIGSRRGLNFDRSPSQLATQRAAFACAHKVVANSEASAAKLRAEGVADRKVAIVPNGLDVDRFAAPLIRKIHRRVILVANLRPEKGHDVLVHSAADVLRRYPDARFDLVGCGPEHDAIRAQLAELNISEAFRLLGEREDVPELLANADIFVLPSRTESMPNALLEAMAAAMPIVASSVGGIPHVIDNDRTGLLTAPGDARALASRICQLMGDAALSVRLGQAARAEVQARYSFERMISALDALYATELAKRGRAHMGRAA